MKNNSCDTEKVIIERERLKFLEWVIKKLEKTSPLTANLLRLALFFFSLSFFIFAVLLALKEGGLLAS